MSMQKTYEPSAFVFPFLSKPFWALSLTVSNSTKSLSMIYDNCLRPKTLFGKNTPTGNRNHVHFILEQINLKFCLLLLFIRFKFVPGDIGFLFSNCNLVNCEINPVKKLHSNTVAMFSRKYLFEFYMKSII